MPRSARNSFIAGNSSSGTSGRGARPQDPVSGSGGEFSLRGILTGSVSTDALVTFTRGFAVMLKAQLPLVKALESARLQTEDEILSGVLSRVKRDVQGGKSLSESLSQHEAFSELYVHLVRVGEAAGILDEVLDQLAKYLERRSRLRRKIRLALIYPGLVLGIALAATSFLLAFIVPTFADLYSDFDAELPEATQFVLGASQFLTSHYLLISGGIVAVGLLVRFVLRTGPGQRAWDWLSTRIPFVGALVLYSLVARFCRTTGTLLSNGIPLVEALEIQADAIPNVHLQSQVREMGRVVRRGGTLSQPAGRSLLPAMVVQMIEVGEETAELDRMLLQAAEHYEDEVEDTAETLTSVLEPVLIVIVGAVVGGLLISLYLPMFNMVNVVG